MPLQILVRQVGPWPMNVYLIACEEAKTAALIDPGADPQAIESLVSGWCVEKILLTHGHRDHTSALRNIRRATGAPVYIHPADSRILRQKFDLPLIDGDRLQLGDAHVRVIHTPGHTGGSCCFDLEDGRVIVGDALFVGGPGRTNNASSFIATMRNMREIFFHWKDDTVFFPGHGPCGCIGRERQAFEAFLLRGWPPGLHGDVTWQGDPHEEPK